MRITLLSISILVFSFSAIAQDLEDILSQIASSAAQSSYQEKYQFSSFIQMSMSEKEDLTMIYDVYLTGEGNATALSFSDAGAKILVIIDSDSNTVLLLTEDEGEKTGIAMGMDPDALAEMTEGLSTEVDSDMEPLKTGNTKKILGYNCNEYLVEEEDTRVQIWVSPELGKEIDQDLQSNNQVFGQVFLHSEDMEGMVMEYNFKDNNSGENRTLKITNINMNTEFSISTGDYAIMSLSQ